MYSMQQKAVSDFKIQAALNKFDWVKVRRKDLDLPQSVLTDLLKLTASAAVQAGEILYCRHINEVAAGQWAGGVVGLKAILGEKNKTKAIDRLNTLAELGYVSYAIDNSTRKLTYNIIGYHPFLIQGDADFACVDNKTGFFAISRNVADKLVANSVRFSDGDAIVDLWAHTVFKDAKNAFCCLSPAVQFGSHAALTLDFLGKRWRWEKSKVSRFFSKYTEYFTLYKLPGSFGSVIYNVKYLENFAAPSKEQVDMLCNAFLSFSKTTRRGAVSDVFNTIISKYSKIIVKSWKNDECTKNSAESKVIDNAEMIDETNDIIVDSPKNDNGTEKDDVNDLPFFYVSGEIEIKHIRRYDIKIERMTSSELKELLKYNGSDNIKRKLKLYLEDLIKYEYFDIALREFYEKENVVYIC